jgi:ribose transport system ATP-binding protein
MESFALTHPSNGTLERLLQVRGLQKTFPGVQALDGVDFDVCAGEVHALVGENGAGKSTLIKILSGAYRPDDGWILVAGQQYRHLSPHLAQSLGIRTIYQERSLVPWTSVAENVLLGRLPGSGFLVNWRRIKAEAQATLDRLGLELDANATVADLPVSSQQSVEIAKALYQQARVVIMDEPTAAFGRPEVERLFRTVCALRDQGLGIVYISHHLEEVFAISDRVTVLRDGRVVGHRRTADTTPRELMSMMVGRDVTGATAKEHVIPGEVLLRIEGISRGATVQNVNLEVRRGEIVGIAGMVGSGRTELARIVFGADRADGGRIYFKGQELKSGDPIDSIIRGIALVPEDRKTQGLVLCQDIVDNINMASLRRRPALLNLGRLEQAARNQAHSLDIRAASLSTEVQYLSGGNQQKVVLAKWLEAGADLFILDEPTRGVDVGAKLEIHRLMVELAKRGKAVLMVSSDLPEVLALSDRILVMRRGRLVGEFTGAEATEQAVIACALGEENAH